MSLTSLIERYSLLSGSWTVLRTPKLIPPLASAAARACRQRRRLGLSLQVPRHERHECGLGIAPLEQRTHLLGDRQFHAALPAEVAGGARRVDALGHHHHGAEDLLELLAPPEPFPHVPVAAVAADRGGETGPHAGEPPERLGRRAHP